MRNNTDINLEKVFGEEEWQLIVEGLFEVRAKKVAALEVLKAEGVRPGGRDFGPVDFGIPKIDALLKRFGEESEGDAASVFDDVEQLRGLRKMVKITAHHGVTDDQRAAVAAFRDSNGREWKEELGSLWMTGNYSRRGIDKDQAALLQQVRNQLGPEWLVKVTRAELDRGDGSAERPRG